MKKTLLLILALFVSFNLAQTTEVDSIPKLTALQIGKFWLPMNYHGSLARPAIGGTFGGLFDEKFAIFSSGFGISGKSDSGLFGNGVFASWALSDYRPGPVGVDSADPRNGIYRVNSSDTPFGNSWQYYRYAVQLGADFYDGDGDGVYTPVDLNSNGVWDPNEDKPYMPGTDNLFMVYNDSRAPGNRRFANMIPLGIEVQHYLFGFNTLAHSHREIIFMRYRLINRGSISDVLDSVLFSIMADPDMGDYSNDFVGVDVNQTGGYVYEWSPDNVWGSMPAALLMRYTGLPYSYLPGVSYSDLNSNGLFDDGIDIPLDSVKVNLGAEFGTNWIRGASQSEFHSFMHSVQPSSVIGLPYSAGALRIYHLGGMTTEGVPINPCTWALGNGSGLANCSSYTSRYMYPALRENNTGWWNSVGSDQRTCVTAGPFRMEKDKPVDITIAYVIGQGNNQTAALQKMRAVGNLAGQLYSSNFTNFTLDGEEPAVLPTQLDLMQNFPNPFNPVTKIRYSVAQQGNVSITVYNLLGQQVALLTNTGHSAGVYELEFNASNLASGIYFYTMEFRPEMGGQSFTASKKLVLMK